MPAEFTILAPRGELRIRRASAADVEALAAIAESTMAWLEALGRDSGRPRMPLRDAIAARIANDEVYLALREGIAASTVTLRWTSDSLWRDLPGDAVYVYSLMVRRDFAGQEVGRYLLAWVADLAAARGKSSLRLDCDATNPALCAYYERAGFAARGAVHFMERTWARFEHPIPAERITTPHGEVVLARARSEDVWTAVAIDEDAVGWVRSLGYEPGHPPRPLAEIYAQTVACGQMYLARREAVAAGKLSITLEDEDLWADQPGDALYVHGLMVRRAFAGKEIGRVLLRWAEREAARQGKPLLRLDCDATDPPLRAYYERAGFTHRGDVTLPHRIAARYEKRVEEGGAST